MPAAERRAPPLLDARLAAAAAYVRRGGVLADIGCDHGRLSVALALQGRCRKIIASDLRPAPLERARRLAALHGCADTVECRLGAGLSVLGAGEAEDLVIAGLSGVTIAEMLAQAPPGFFAAGDGVRLILVPASKHAFLRGELAQQGFALLDETPVLAAGRYYTVMYAAYDGTARTPTPLECAVGRSAHGPDAAGYLLHTADCLQKEARGAGPGEQERLTALAGAVREVAASCRH